MLTFVRTVLVCCLLLFCSGAPQAADSTASLAITNIDVIDVATGSVDQNRTVVVMGNRIHLIGRADEVVPPAGAVVVDGTDGYLIPGLWDMHVHAVEEADYEPFMKLFMINGITGFRDMWGDLAIADLIRSEVEAGQRVAPRFIVAGHLIDGPDPFWPGSLVVTTPAHARAVVDSLKEAGADFIKIYPGISPGAFFAIVERGQEIGIYTTGHLPSQVSIADASDAGQRSMEHLYDVLRGMSTEEARLLDLAADRAAAKRAGGPVQSRVEYLRTKDGITLATQDDELCQGLCRRFVKNDTWQVPTAVCFRGAAFQKDWTLEELLKDPRSRYFEIPDFWLPEGDPVVEGFADEDWEILRALYERMLAVVGIMNRMGVPLLAGTDTPNPGVYPGFSLHDELELFVGAGMTPLEALQTATINAARFLEAEDSLGTVAQGNIADLVVLDGNPLEDISNTTRIRAVILDGTLLDRETLDGMLDELESAIGVQSQ